MKNQSRVPTLWGTVLMAMALALSGITWGWCDDAGVGKKIFEAKCAQCHGKDAKGDPKMVKVLKIEPVLVDLTRSDAVKFTDEKIITTVTHGNKKMPKYVGKLTTEEIQSVVKYLRILQSASAGAPAKPAVTPSKTKKKNKK